MKKMLGKIGRKSGGKEDAEDDELVVLGKGVLRSRRNSGVSPMPLRRRFSLRAPRSPARAICSFDHPDTQSTEPRTPMSWAHSDHHRPSPASPPEISLEPRASLLPTAALPRRRMSVSLSPSSLRAATRSMAQAGGLITGREDVNISPYSPDSPPGNVTRDGAAGESKSEGKTRYTRRRSMSLVFGHAGANTRSSLQPQFSSPGADVSGDNSPERAGLRKRLRQKAFDGLRRTGSVSPSRMRERYGGGTSGSEGTPRLSFTGPVDMLKTIHSLAATTELPSLLDLAPDRKRPWIMRRLKEREAEFTTYNKIGIYCGTWNVNSKKPHSTDPRWLSEWLCPEMDEHSSNKPLAKTSEEGDDSGGEANEDGMHDIYAIGLQELVDLNAVNVTIDTKSQRMSAVWEDGVASTLNHAAQRGLHRSLSRKSSVDDRTVEGEGSDRLYRRRANSDGKEGLEDSDIESEYSSGDVSSSTSDDVVGAVEWARRSKSGVIDTGSVEPGCRGQGSQKAGGRGESVGGSPQRGGRLRQERTFVLVAKEHLVGTWLAVFVRASMLRDVSDIRTGTVTAGMLGLMGNKGGVGIRFRLRNGSLCFVSSHLAAHRENVRARNDNYVKIVKGLVFSPVAVAENRAKQKQQRQQMQQVAQKAGTTGPPSLPRCGTQRRRQTVCSTASSPRSVASAQSFLRSLSPLGSPISSLSPSPSETPTSGLSRPPRLNGDEASAATLSPPGSPGWSVVNNEVLPPLPLRPGQPVSPEDVPPPLPIRTWTAPSKGDVGERENVTGKSGTCRVRSFTNSVTTSAAASFVRKLEEADCAANPEAIVPNCPVGSRERHDRQDQTVGNVSAQPSLYGWTTRANDGRVLESSVTGDEPRPLAVADVFADENEGHIQPETGDATMRRARTDSEARPTQLLRPPEFGNQNMEDLSLQDHDVVFWLGDLNYRIDASVPAAEVLEHALANHLHHLRARDQLNLAREAADSFVGFQEAEIDFRPTYKYAPGTDEYDVRPDKKFRAPAWCDRVLFWTGESCGVRGAGGVKQLDYRRSETPMSSDHKPVSASFHFDCKQIDTEAYTKALMDLIEVASTSSEDRQAKVDVMEGGSAVDFGVLRYKTWRTRSIWVQSSGSVPATFSVHSAHHALPSPMRAALLKEDLPSTLQQTEEGEAYRSEVGGGCKSEAGRGFNDVYAEGLGPAAWYKVHPERATLLPGEKLEIEFRAFVQDPTARALASGEMSRSLEDMVVVRVEEGSDRYISVLASCAPSVYGSSLEAMVDANAAVDQRSGMAKPPGSIDGQEPERLPSQIWEMVNALLEGKGHCQEPGLFLQKGIGEEVEAIREAVDARAPLPKQHSAHSMAEALVTLLASLYPPLIPEHACPTEDGRRRWHVGANACVLLKKLPPLHYTAFVYIVSFFRALLAHGDQNGLTAVRIVPVLRTCFLPDHLRQTTCAPGDVPAAQDLPVVDDTAKRASSLHLITRRGTNGGKKGGTENETAAEPEENSADAIDEILHYLLVNESP